MGEIQGEKKNPSPFLASTVGSKLAQGCIGQTGRGCHYF